MAQTTAIYYRDKRGVEPVDRFIDGLPAKRAAKIDDYVQEHLNGKPSDAQPPEHPITSQIEGELRELRVRFANTRYRVLYQRSGKPDRPPARLREGHRGCADCREDAGEAAHGRLQATDGREAAGATAGGRSRCATRQPRTGLTHLSI